MNGHVREREEFLRTSVLWYALKVKSRHEFVARNGLMLKKVETFLPSANRLRFWKDRRKLVEFPLFPGYLFVHIRSDAESYLNVLNTRGVVAFVSLQQGSPEPVPHEEIDSLRVLAESGKDIDVYPGIKQGTRVRVKRGPLMGAEGTLKRKEDGNILFVSINILGRSLGVRIYDDDVEVA